MRFVKFSFVRVNEKQIITWESASKDLPCELSQSSVMSNTHTVCILLYNSFPQTGFIKPYGFVIVCVFFIKAQIIKQLTIT